MSEHLREATIAIEDDSFYDHWGIRPLSIIRSVLANLQAGSFAQGGSTITQQVVKMTLLTKDKTLTRKIKEWVLALKLERLYTKDQILETYLNEAPYGGTVYGVEEASNYFFGKSALDVSLAEAAYLAALPQAPTYYSPFGNHRDALEARKKLVLSQMLKNDFITQEEHDAAIEEKVEFKAEGTAGVKAPHFVFYVREYLESKYGFQAVNEEGLQVITTLDWELQEKAEEIVRKAALANEQNFDAENAGLVAISPERGDVLAMVGSRGYFDEAIDGKVNVTLANRQPGSSFKPFVYAAALEKGYTTETVVFDLKTQFAAPCGATNLSDEPPCYSPGNYDGVFRGPVTFRNALAQSINVPAVKALYLVGIQNAIDMAERLGITTLTDPDRYGLTLVLGGGEVNLLEMTSAYGVFANDGVRAPATPILKVTDAEGRVLEEYTDRAVRVVDAEIARSINDVLSDNEARTPEFGANSPLYFPGYDVAAKTGTTNDYRDVWILGYTPAVAAGAWAGNNDNHAMQRKIAAFIVAPMWHEFMEEAMQRYPAGTFPSPQPLPQDLPPILRGVWDQNPAEGAHDILYWVKKNDPRSGRPDNPWADPQFSLWEYPVSLWTGGQTAGTTTGDGAQSIFSITQPSPGQTLTVNQTYTLQVSHPEMHAIERVFYYANGTYVGSSSVRPYEVQFQPKNPGSVTLRAVAQGTFGAQETQASYTAQ